MARTVEVSCPCCGDGDVEVEVTVERGCRYTRNGDGWPSSYSTSIVKATCTCWDNQFATTGKPGASEQDMEQLDEAALEKAAESQYDPKWDYEEQD